jgi:hypothetical protein
MLKRALFLGITAGFLSGLACHVLMFVYKETMFVDFSPVMKAYQLYAASIFACVLASMGYIAAMKLLPRFGEIIFNLLFVILSFASIISPIMHIFPPELDVKGIDEITSYFIPFAITLHFFPAIAWFALKPIFVKPILIKSV